MAEIWEVGKILAVTEDFFSKRGIESARLDAELLLADTLEVSREILLARREQRLTDIELSAYRERVRHRAGNKPVAHLIGHREFYSLPFYVDKNVLIPRPETELLVDLAAKWVNHESKIQNLKSKIQICDVGTGSGCIAAAVATHCPTACVTATEFSLAAAGIAVQNLSALGLLDRVRVVLCDLFPLGSTERFDVIVSNPPYLSLEEFESLPPGIRKFEPRMALTDEEDGTTIYRRLFRMARKRLIDGGVIFVEISPRIAGRIADGSLLKDLPFTCVATHPDLAGLPRAAELRLNPA